MPEQQLVEIARALGADARVSDPGRADRVADRLARSTRCSTSIRRLRAQGVGIVYISHRLDEVLAIADRITVLRDGRHREHRACAAS